MDDALPVSTDVGDPARVRALVDATNTAARRVDGLVNNAGASFHGPLEGVDLVECGRLLQLTVFSVLAAIQAVPPVMRRQHAGRIIKVSSGTAVVDPPGVGAYASSKAAVNMLSAMTRKELAAEGIAVSLVLPPSPRPSSAGHVPRQRQTAARHGAHSPGFVARDILSATHRRGTHRHCSRPHRGTLFVNTGFVMTVAVSPASVRQPPTAANAHPHHAAPLQ